MLGDPDEPIHDDPGIHLNCMALRRVIAREPDGYLAYELEAVCAECVTIGLMTSHGIGYKATEEGKAYLAEHS